MPLKPTAILNFNETDNSLDRVVVNLWNLLWGRETTGIDREARLPLSLANGVGEGSYRQAARESAKAYALGAGVAEPDEL